MSDMAIDFKPREFTVEEYHRLADVGVLRANERVELIDGVIEEMSPIGPPHWDLHARLVRYLIEALGDAALVVGQGSFPLGPKSEPQPDIAILAPGRYAHIVAPLGGEAFFAVIELAQSSLGKDLGRKLRLYARAGIADYLVVDLEGDTLFHFSDPHELGYRREEQLSKAMTFRLTRPSDVTLSSDPFLT